MNTAEFDTRLRHQHGVSSGAEAPSPAPAGVPITILSTDPDLCEAIRTAATPQHPVFIADTLEAAGELGAAGHCCILVTDQALNQQSLVRMSRQMRTYDPATITIAVGSRGDDHALIGLLSSAVVERFMLKPVTPALARLVLRSASSEYQSLRSRRRREAAAAESAPAAAAAEEAPAGDPVRIGAKVIPLSRIDVPMPEQPAPEPKTQFSMRPVVVEPAPQVKPEEKPVTTPPSQSLTPWIAGAIAALAVGIAVWLTMQQRIPQIDPQQVIATNLDAAAKALAAGQYADPPEASALHHYGIVLSLDPSNATAKQGISHVADGMIEGVKAAIVDGRLAEAGIALERVRRVDPANRRLPLLEEQLRKAQTDQLTLLQARAEPPVPVAAAAAKPARANTASRRAPATEKVQEPAALPIAEAKVDAKPQALTTRPIDPNDPLALGPPAPPAQTQTATRLPEAAVAGAAVADAAVIQTPVEKSAGSPPAPVPAAAEVADRRLVKVVEPEYPDEARMRGIEGWVDLKLAVDASGAVRDATVEGGKNGRLLDRAALAAVRKWRYEPRALSGPGTTEPLRVRVHFKLEE